MGLIFSGRIVLRLKPYFRSMVHLFTGYLFRRPGISRPIIEGWLRRAVTYSHEQQEAVNVYTRLFCLAQINHIVKLFFERVANERRKYIKLFELFLAHQLLQFVLFSSNAYILRRLD